MKKLYFCITFFLHALDLFYPDTNIYRQTPGTKNKAYISEDKITQKQSTQKGRNETNRQIGIKNRQVELKNRQIIEKKQMNGEKKNCTYTDRYALFFIYTTSFVDNTNPYSVKV